MRFFRYAISAILVVIFGAAIYQTLLWLGLWGGTQDSQVKSLEDGDQEIALIEPATSGDEWGRLVTAVQLVQHNWPKINPALPALNVNLDDAFPKLTAAVPEIVLSMAGTKRQKLRIRWYKISGEHDADSWVEKLHKRARPPLAIIGGGTSDRAVRLARALRATYPNAEDPSPIFLITTATAERTAEDTPVIDEYPQRSFRFSFTNKRMVEALLKFVQQTEDLWVSKNTPRPGPDTRYTMHAVPWQDERYSQDLTVLFEKEFLARYKKKGEFVREAPILYGVGDYFDAAPLEQDAVGTFLASRKGIPPYSFLVLPTQTVRMRRFLIHLKERSPFDARNLVVLNGDAISFHSVFRDRDVAWNILRLPYSLVFFAHRNPIDRTAGFTDVPVSEEANRDAFPKRSTSGTHDILLYRDILEATLYAAYDQHKLLSDSLLVRERLRATCWYRPPVEKMKDDPPRVCNPQVQGAPANHRPFFSKKGNRDRDTGEHVVWVKPSFTEDRVDLTSTISVWFMVPGTKGDQWHVVEEPFRVEYNQNR